MSASMSARFTVTIDVPVGEWDEKATFASIREQVSREAASKLRNDLQSIDYKIVGNPEIKFIMGGTRHG